MWTIKYKGYYIHGYCDKDECKWNDIDSNLNKRSKSLQAAKVAITKHIQSVDKE